MAGFTVWGFRLLAHPLPLSISACRKLEQIAQKNIVFCRSLYARYQAIHMYNMANDAEKWGETANDYGHFNGRKYIYIICNSRCCKTMLHLFVFIGWRIWVFPSECMARAVVDFAPRAVIWNRRNAIYLWTLSTYCYRNCCPYSLLY